MQVRVQGLGQELQQASSHLSLVPFCLKGWVKKRERRSTSKSTCQNDSWKSSGGSVDPQPSVLKVDPEY